MKDYMTEFEGYLTDVKKSSANTRDAYLRDVGQFVSYCTMNGTRTLEKVDSNFIEKYSDYLTFLGKSEATKSRIIASLRCYFKHMVSIGVMVNNPTDGMKLQRSARKLPEVLDAGETITLLSQPSGEDFKSIRDKAMLELLYATGIKVSELILLKVTDINLQIGILNMHGGRHERIVPIYPAAVKALADYILNVRPIIVTSSDEDRLFTNMNGLPMSRQGFWKIIKHYAETAGIKKDITPHTLRHSFAAHLLENGAQLKDIKEMLGHSDISSTQVYARFVKSKYTESYARFHPLAK